MADATSKAREFAYRETRYVAHLPPPVRHLTLRIGALHPELDAFLATEKLGGEWVFITAWNPGEERPGAEQNARANGKLRLQLSALGLPHWNGVGTSRDGAFSEFSFLVAGVDKALALQLSREFRQAAVVIGSSGEKADLLWAG